MKKGLIGGGLRSRWTIGNSNLIPILYLLFFIIIITIAIVFLIVKII
mgnify:CR=1 FL=1